MAYRLLEMRLRVGDDSTLDQLVADIAATISQAKDLQVAHVHKRIAPADAEAIVSIAPVTTGYFLAIVSDYPVMFRVNGASATQFTMKTNNVAATSAGAPLPYQCVHISSVTTTSVYLAPIASAAQTANCKVIVVGDPANSYT